eukprot:scaffold3009_cov108-Isochrysis_galbana.AAC.4
MTARSGGVSHEGGRVHCITRRRRMLARPRSGGSRDVGRRRRPRTIEEYVELGGRETREPAHPKDF